MIPPARSRPDDDATQGVGGHPLALAPITLRDAAAFVAHHHRHLGPPRGHRFSIAAVAGASLVGVVIVGRPVARMLDDGHAAEVTRLCTTGYPNSCSFLLGAAWRAARAIGYRRMITYSRADEPGISLRAAGWTLIAIRSARSGWHTPARPRTATGAEHVARNLWMVTTSGEHHVGSHAVRHPDHATRNPVAGSRPTCAPAGEVA